MDYGPQPRPGSLTLGHRRYNRRPRRLLEPGLGFADLSGKFQRRVPAPLVESASVAWCTVTVKLRPGGKAPDKAPAGLGSAAPSPAHSGGLARLPHRPPHGAKSHPLAVQQQACPEDSG